MARDLTLAIEKAYAERTDLLVLALTGRTGSGCTTTANALTKNFEELSVSMSGLNSIEARKLDICRNYAKNSWVRFKALTVSTVIFSFLLHEERSELDRFLKKIIKGQRSSQLSEEICDQLDELRRNYLYSSFYKLTGPEHDQQSAADAWEFYSGPLSESIPKLRTALGSAIYASTFQTLGDNIRKSGSAISDTVDPDHVFTLITRVKRLAKAAGKNDRRRGIKSTRVVIDAVRNPLELVYLRDQFAAFFSLAVTADEDDRQSRLSDSGMGKRDIENLDKREYSKKSLGSYDAFVSQNLQECIQKSDIFIHNNGKPDEIEINRQQLHQQLIRYVALILRPGLVTPTADERCMQLAFVAKLNSGCISRQVGAAITDSSFSIKAVGWNDVPRGQVSCLLRDVNTLLSSRDEVAFSYYESTNKPFRAHIASEFSNSNIMKTSTGLNCPYCFKDAYNAVTKKENQVHTRALHAEENAFLQLAKLGNSGIAGGQLYTTASPCELCSKKAYQLGITEIIYVDPYPGISSTHILAVGMESSRPKLRLFGGAVGNAYHRLYEPVLPIKDEFKARLQDDPPPTLL
jgi:deoxycytidylate deaminase